MEAGCVSFVTARMKKHIESQVVSLFCTGNDRYWFLLAYG